MSRKDAKDAKVNVLGTERIWRGYGEDWGLAGKQAFWADMGRHSELIWGRHSVLRTSYQRKICRSYGAVFEGCC